MHKAQTTISDRESLIDNGGRRFGTDRRTYTYNGYLPERRVSDDRRSGTDRRKKSRFP